MESKYHIIRMLLYGGQKGTDYRGYFSNPAVILKTNLSINRNHLSMSCKEFLEPLQLRVEQSKARGRFLVTGKQIPAGMSFFSLLNYIGTTILKCKPLSYAITNDKHKNVCCNCFKEYGKLSACAKCNCACYCSRQCQVADWYGFPN